MIDVELIEQFFDRLDEMPEKHRVKFKRSVGYATSEVNADVLMQLYSILPQGLSSWQEDMFLFAASIHSQWKSDVNDRISMEEALARAKYGDGEKEFSDSFEKRIVDLLDQNWDGQGFFCRKYYKLICYIKQRGYAIDGRSVLMDIIYWNSPYRLVQKRWIRRLANNSTENKKENKKDVN